MVEPQLWATLDYTTSIDPNAQACLTWNVSQAGTGHGLSVWFDTELLPGIRYSNAPDAPHIPIYSQIFFPWSEPVDLSIGDRVEVRFRVHLMQDHYVWSWYTCVDNSTQTQSKARFRQASFAAQPTVPVFDEEA